MGLGEGRKQDRKKQVVGKGKKGEKREISRWERGEEEKKMERKGEGLIDRLIDGFFKTPGNDER